MKVKSRVMNISKKEAAKTLKKFKGTAWDQSPLFKRIYEEEFGQLGGEPYGCLVGDYHFDHSPQFHYVYLEKGDIKNLEIIELAKRG